MVTKQQAIVVLSSVAIVVVLFYPTLLGNFLNEKFGAAFIIKPLDDLDTKYFFVTDWWISNLARAEYVFPYDTLHYHAIVTNKLPYPTIAKYTLKLNSGDSHPIIADVTMLLGPNSPGEISHEFSTNREGYHDVELVLSLYNGTTDFNSVVTPLEQQLRSTKLDVLSLNDKLLAEQNRYIFVGLIVSSVIGFITTIALRKQIKTANEQITELKTQNLGLDNQFEESKKQTEHFKIQNDILQDQFKRENRPWIAFDDSVEHQIELEPNSIRIYMKNLGKSVAHDVHTISLSTISEMNVIELLKHGVWDKPVSFAPNESYVQPVELPHSITKSEDLAQFYVGLFVRYKIEYSKYGAFIMITRMDRIDKKNDLIILRKLY